LIQEARRLGVRLDLFEAGGYENLQTQRQQIAACVKGGAKGLILGAISADGLNDLIASYSARSIPVVDLINGVSSSAVAARVGADFYDMGLGLEEKRNELLAKGVEVTDVVDHDWAKSIYFKDPNGIQLEYCCLTRNLDANDARMQDRFEISVRRLWLEEDETALSSAKR
jgi:hypothetical protein